MINKRFELIDRGDIDALVLNKICERKTIEYKETLPGGSDHQKLEFLADISSFANALGGDVFYGIRERRDSEGAPTGIPEASIGLSKINIDAEIQRLENIIRDSIAPRIPGVQSIAIPGFKTGPVIVLRIPKSWSAPHMVTFKGHSRFYSRNSSGKYPLDVTEIRSAFALSESLPERIRHFRDDRIAKNVADETPVPLEATARIILHILPIQALERTTLIDITKLSLGSNFIDVFPIASQKATDWRFNFDGFVTHTWNSSLNGGYVQVFRNGAIEAVDVSMLKEKDGRKLIPCHTYEEKLISALAKYLRVEKGFVIDPPIFVMLSMVGIKGYELAVARERFNNFQGYPIDRDVLLLPDFIIDNYEVEPASLLRPAFDAIWQAAGWDCSKNYKEGKWVGML